MPGMFQLGRSQAQKTFRVSAKRGAGGGLPPPRGAWKKRGWPHGVWG